MAIAVGGSDETPMSDINTTPLVDVMLVMLIIFIIAVPVALQTVEELEIPVFRSVESDKKVENLLLTVTTTDEAGRTPELVAFKRLDTIVQRAGGAEAMMENPDLIPQVHIRADVNTPWRCVAGAIYNIQAAGYPTVGFISNPVDPNN